jgi:small-conductance mechanosensitive channel
MQTLGRFLEWATLLLAREFTLVLAALVVVASLVLGFVVYRVLDGALDRLGVPNVVEGTPFERTAQRFGTSTVRLVSQLSGLFVVAVGVVVALRLVDVLSATLFTSRLAGYLPNLFVAALVVIIGLILGDKAELATSERLRSIKLPEVTVIPTLTKYSVLFIAFLVALAQLGVAVSALLVLLAAYTFGLFFLGGLAFKQMLTSSAAGVYLLLTEPYSIGDEIEIDGRRGIVQEVDVFVTRIEDDGEEYVLPNHLVFESGIVRVRS